MVADLASDLACALDPVAYVRRAGIEPDEWQARCLRSPRRRKLLKCCRQSGKSTTVAGMVMHRAEYKPGSLILLLSPGERQSKEIFRKAKVIRAHQSDDGPLVEAESESGLALELPNGSRIIALPGADPGKIRSFSGVEMLVIDEAALVSDLLYHTVRPMLAVSGGELVAMSTPFGKRGWFYEAYEMGGADWERYEVTADACPRITPEFLAEEKRTLPAWFFNQEYLVIFGENIDAVFSHEIVQRAITSDVLPFFGG